MESCIADTYITSSMNWNDSVHILCENEWKVIKKKPHIYINQETNVVQSATIILGLRNFAF